MIKHDENFEKKNNKKKYNMKLIKHHVKNLSIWASFMDEEIININKKLDKILSRLTIINNGGKWKGVDDNLIYEEEIDEKDMTSLMNLMNSNSDDPKYSQDNSDKVDSTMEALDELPQTKRIRNLFIMNFIDHCSDDISEKIINKRFEKILNQVKDKNDRSNLYDDLFSEIKEMIVSIVNDIEKYEYSNDEINSLLINKFEKYWENTLKPLIKSYTKLRNNQKRDFMKEKSTIKDALVSREIININ